MSSDITDKARGTDTSFTSTDSSEHGPNNAARLLQLLGRMSKKKLEHQRFLFRGAESLNAHLKELAKLDKYPKHEEVNWQKANEEEDRQKA